MTANKDGSGAGLGQISVDFGFADFEFRVLIFARRFVGSDTQNIAGLGGSKIHPRISIGPLKH